MSPNTITYRIEDRIYVNLTNRCSLACQFCPKQSGDFSLHEYDLSLKKHPSAQQAIGELKTYTDFSEIVFCGYGESTFRLHAMLEVAQWGKGQDKKVRLNTDGLGNLMHKRNILPELSENIDSLSISLNAQNEAIYQQHCQPSLEGSYQAVRDFVSLAPRYIKDVTATAIDGLEGVDINACEQIATDAGVKFKARQLDQLG